MAMIRRPPRRELSPFVSALWASGASAASAASGTSAASGASDGASDEHGAHGERELVLPTGAMHVVIRLDHPLRVFDAIDTAAPRTIGHAIIGGARASAYVRDVSRPACSVGAQLRPGAAELVLGVPALDLAGHHTRLDDVWGPFAAELRERLAATGDPHQRLALFEAALFARLPRVRGVHPAVAHALAQFAATDDVGAVVDEVGYSHRGFIAMFRHAVGLPPKLYCRVQRLQRAIAQMPASSLALVAAGAGFSDQAHLSREFRELAGVSPGEYRTLVPRPSNHVPLRALGTPSR